MTIFAESLRAFLLPIAPYLDDPSITEIMVNGHQDVWVEQGGRLFRTPAQFTEQGLMAAARNLAQYVGRPLTDERPRLDARLPDGSRVHVVLPPIARCGTTIAIRKFSSSTLSMDQLVQYGSATAEAVRLLEACVTCRKNVMVSGGTGSGKTTLLNVIGALDSPTSGRIVVAGRDITRASRRELARFRRHSVSFIFQSFNLFPGLTALENVEFGADVAGRPGARGIARATLDRVGLGERTAHFPHELSGGEQQRVAIARALASGNPVMLADEPTGELDFHTGVQILDLLHDQTHEEGTSILVVTHNREIARMADRVIELSSGRIVSDAPNPGGPASSTELQW